MLYNPSYKKECPELDESFKLLMESLKSCHCHNIAKVNNFGSTGQALIYLCFQIKRICNATLLLYLEDYAMMILYRSIIEHFIKHAYIFMRFHTEHNDDVGKDYYENCTYKEMINKAIAFTYPNKLKIKSDMKQDHKEALNNAGRFSFSYMIDYIYEYCIETGLEEEDESKKAMRQAKNDYSICSSFTHGGPEAITMKMEIDKRIIQSQSTGYALLAQLHTIQTFANFDSPDKENLQETHKKIRELLDTVFKNWPSENDDKENKGV